MIRVARSIAPLACSIRWCFGCAMWTWKGEPCEGCGGEPA